MVTSHFIVLDWTFLFQTEINATVAFFIIDIPTRDVFLGLPFIQRYQEFINWKLIGKSKPYQKTDYNIKCNCLDIADYLKELRNPEQVPGMLYIQTLTPENTQIPTETEVSGVAHLKEKLIKEYSDVLTNDPPSTLPPKINLVHRIILQRPNDTTFRRQYKLSHAEQIELTKQVNDLMKRNWIRPSASPFNSPVLFVKKKDGSLRMCVDYRALNNLTIKDKFPIPDIEKLTSDLGKAKVYSKLDLMSGYYQVRIEETDIDKTAFSTENGHYEWMVMPFGLPNAPSTFQRLMNNILAPYLSKFVKVYIDDILIYSEHTADHFDHVRTVLQTLRENKLIAKLSKCAFFFKKLRFLGFVITPEGVETDPDKIKVIKEWPTPTSIKEAQSFLGFTVVFTEDLFNDIH